MLSQALKAAYDDLEQELANTQAALTEAHLVIEAQRKELLKKEKQIHKLRAAAQPTLSASPRTPSSSGLEQLASDGIWYNPETDLIRYQDRDVRAEMPITPRADALAAMRRSSASSTSITEPAQHREPEPVHHREPEPVHHREPEPEPEPEPVHHREPEPEPEPEPVHHREPEPEPVHHREPEPEPVHHREPEPVHHREPEPEQIGRAHV